MKNSFKVFMVVLATVGLVACAGANVSQKDGEDAFHMTRALITNLGSVPLYNNYPGRITGEQRNEVRFDNLSPTGFLTAHGQDLPYTSVSGTFALTGNMFEIQVDLTLEGGPVSSISYLLDQNSFLGTDLPMVIPVMINDVEREIKLTAQGLAPWEYKQSMRY